MTKDKGEELDVAKDDDVQVEGLVIGGMTSGTVKIGGREVEIGPDGKPVED